MKSEEGIFVVGADGSDYDDDNVNDGYRLGTYQVNFKKTGGRYDEIESIEYKQDLTKRWGWFELIANHGIRYKKSNTKEENDYASYFFIMVSLKLLLKR